VQCLLLVFTIFEVLEGSIHVGKAGPEPLYLYTLYRYNIMGLYLYTLYRYMGLYRYRPALHVGNELESSAIKLQLKAQ
jgi:hypothetical protein